MVDIYFPPHFSYYQPYIALPSLKAFLEGNNIHCNIHDLNIRSFHYLINPNYIKKCFKKIEEQISAFESKSELDEKEFSYYEQLIQGRLAYPLVAEFIEKAITFFQDEEQILDFKKYQLFERVVDNAFKIISTAFYPTLISLSDFSMEYSFESSIEIEAAIADEEENPFIGYFQNYLKENELKQDDKLLGISITATSQMIPAFTLAKILRKKYPEKKIVLGGVISNHLAVKFTRSQSLNKYFDFLISGEGETALLGLTKHLENGFEIEQIPNLYYKSNGQWRSNNKLIVEQVEKIPTPNYDGFPLDAYLAPKPILSIEPGRGCYYRKCTFCNQHSIHKGHFNIKKVDSIFNQIRVLKKKYNSNYFNLSNEGIPILHLKKLALKLIEEKTDIYWYAGARLSDKLDVETCQTLYKSGCRKLLFGLESGNQRILDLMKKDVNLDKVPYIFNNCKKAGIDIVTYLMIGFPTEKEHEINDTTQFIIKNLPNILPEGFVFYISVFQAMIDSPILELLPEYGYELIEKDGYDLIYIYTHKKTKDDSKYTRVFYEDKIKEMNSLIYEKLPPQSLPLNISHYMAYKAHKHSVKADDKNNVDLESTRIKTSQWISFGDAKFICSNGDKLVYSLLTNKSYLINADGKEILDYLQRPCDIKEIKKEFNEVVSIDDYLKFVINNKICIQV